MFAYIMGLGLPELIMVFFFVVLPFAAFILVAYAIGKPKGRSASWGLLGIIGLLIVFLLPPKTGTGVLEECPHCREPMKIGASVCPHCQSKITMVQPV